MKVGVADYGMIVWDGGIFDTIKRFQDLSTIGYDGTERIRPMSAEEAMTKAGQIRQLGLDFATCHGPNQELCIQWTAAFGKSYVWALNQAKDFDTLCRQVNIQTEIANRWGVEVAMHNHLGTLVETQEEVIRFLEACPNTKLLLDTGHLSVAEGGDAVYIVDNYFDRIEAVHVKEWVYTNEEAEVWSDRGYFCELGGGNIAVPNDIVVKKLIEKGYDGWIFVEHDTHLQEPLLDLKKSREILRSYGV